MMRERFPELGQFFGCYLHQDWRLEASDWQGAAQNYVEHEPPELVKAATTQLGQLLAMDLNDQHLEAVLDEMGNAFDPGPLSYGTWLGELHWYLRRGIRP